MSIEITGVSKQFSVPGSPTSGRFHALKNVSTGIETGKLLALVGESGSGKTTILRSLAGLENPDSGEINIGGRSVFSSSQNINVATEKRDIGLIFQSYALWPHLTVERNVAYPLERRGMARIDRERRVREYLALVGCGELAGRYPHELSGGQQQRVALARALVYEPQVVLFDEPLSNLDATLRDHLRLQIGEIQRRVGFTAVYVTHDQSEAFYLADKIALLKHGVILQSGAPSDLFELPASVDVAHFVGATNRLTGSVVKDGAFFSALGIGEIELPSQSHVGKEDAVLMARPEALHFSDRAEGSIPGQVIDRRFVGRTIEYAVKVGNDLTWMVRSEGTGSAQIGEQVRLRLMPTGAFIFKRPT